MKEKQNNTRCEKKSACIRTIFTLIELLIVIAIISILAGMLLPALNLAREKAYAVSCFVRLNDFGKAAILYAQDYKEYFPVKKGNENIDLVGHYSTTTSTLWYYCFANHGTYLGGQAITIKIVDQPDWLAWRKKFLRCPSDSVQFENSNTGNISYCWVSGVGAPALKLAGRHSIKNTKPGVIHCIETIPQFCSNYCTLVRRTKKGAHGNLVHLLYADGHTASREAGTQLRYQGTSSKPYDGTIYFDEYKIP